MSGCCNGAVNDPNNTNCSTPPIFPIASVVQTTGTNIRNIMSQNAVKNTTLEPTTMTIELGKLINSFKIIKQTPTSTIQGHYLDPSGGLAVGAEYYVDIYEIASIPGAIIMGDTGGYVTAVAYYGDILLTNLISLGITCNVETNLRVIDTIRNAPSGALYVAVTNTIYVPEEENRIQVIELDARYTSDNYITKLMDAVFSDTNTEVSTSSVIPDKYINTNGSVVSNFPGYCIDVYNVTEGNEYKLIGDSAGAICTAAYYTDNTLSTLVSTVYLHNTTGSYPVDIKTTAPINATVIGVTRAIAVINPTILYTFTSYNISNIPINNSTSDVVCWGDSLTYGYGGGATTYPNTLQTLIGSGSTVFNAGVGGENTYEISARQGGEPMLIATNIILPSTTDYVVTTFKNSIGTVLHPLVQGGSEHINPCIIDGIECTIILDSGVYKVKRNIANSSSRVINADTIVFGNYMKNKRKPYAMSLFMGTNKSYTDGNDLANQYEKILKYSGINNYVIVGQHGYDDPSILIPVEQILLQRFGANYINWRDYVSTHGLEDAGIVPTAQDLIAMGEGKCPPSLLVDSVHLNAAGYSLLGNLVYKRFKSLNIF